MADEMGWRLAEGWDPVSERTERAELGPPIARYRLLAEQNSIFLIGSPIAQACEYVKVTRSNMQATITDQPSGNEGGDCVGPSWFPGVGGPLITERLMVRAD